MIDGAQVMLSASGPAVGPCYFNRHVREAGRRSTAAIGLSALALLLGACGGHASRADAERKRAEAACKNGDGPSCFVAAAGVDNTKKATLEHSMAMWKRGCDLGHGPSCAQLATVAELGMTSGGAHPDPALARAMYSLACKRGDNDSCKRIDDPLQGPVPAPSGPFPWREALTPVCGKNPGQLGALFDGLVLGEPMPDVVQLRVRAFEKKYGAHVRYNPEDKQLHWQWSLDVDFPAKDGIWPVLVAGWGRPDLPFGAWFDAPDHLIAYYVHPSEGSGLAWSAYRTIDEVIRPDDKDRLGFEPLPVVGAKLSDVKAALGDRLVQRYEDEYEWNAIGPGPGFEVHIVEKRGVVTELRTVNWATNSPVVGDALFAALEKKWGAPKIDKDGVHVWRLPGRVVHASKPASGNFEIVIARR